jgi:hypothetical protein
MSLDFVFGLPKDSEGNTGIVVFVDRLSKMAHLAVVPDTVDGEGTAKLFIDRVFRQHGLPVSIVSDRDPGKFWDAVFKVLGTKLDMSTEDHPQTDGQTVRVNRVVEDILRSVCAETPKRWRAMLPLVEFALNNAVHASTGRQNSSESRYVVVFMKLFIPDGFLLDDRSNTYKDDVLARGLRKLFYSSLSRDGSTKRSRQRTASAAPASQVWRLG